MADAKSSPSRLLYRVRNWDSLFENAQSRKCARLNWVSVPNKHDGAGYRRLISAENGPAMYGVWVLILQVASKCPMRGVLADEDGPFDAEDLSHKTGCSAELFSTTLETLCKPRIHWLEAEQVGDDWQLTPTLLPQRPIVSSLNRTEPDRTEPNRKTRKPDSGVCVSGSGKTPGSRPSVFDDITLEVLKDNRRLLHWFQTKAVNDKRLKLLNTEPNALNVFAAAERAIEVTNDEGGDPVKLFVFIVGKRQWNLISNEQEDLAKKRLNELKRDVASSRPPMTSSPTSDANADPQSIAQSLASYLPKSLDTKAAENSQQPRAAASGSTT